jgi:hypothetical protein
MAVTASAIFVIGLFLGQLAANAQETPEAPTEAAAAPDLEEAPAAAEESATVEGAFSTDELQALVAPVALYPDLVLVLTLQASLAPLDIVQAERFLADYAEDPSLEPDPGWDDIVIGLLNYPTVVRTMSADLTWTENLGTAVLTQLEGVQDAIQEFRAFMRAIGALESNEQVTTIAEGDIIPIEPTDENAVFIPQYDPDALLAALYSTETALAPAETGAEATAEPEGEAVADEAVTETAEIEEIAPVEEPAPTFHTTGRPFPDGTCVAPSARSQPTISVVGVQTGDLPSPPAESTRRRTRAHAADGRQLLHLGRGEHGRQRREASMAVPGSRPFSMVGMHQHLGQVRETASVVNRIFPSDASLEPLRDDGIALRVGDEVGVAQAGRGVRFECLFDGTEEIADRDIVKRRVRMRPAVFDTGREQVLLDENHMDELVGHRRQSASMAWALDQADRLRGVVSDEIQPVAPENPTAVAPAVGAALSIPAPLRRQPGAIRAPQRTLHDFGLVERPTWNERLRVLRKNRR